MMPKGTRIREMTAEAKAIEQASAKEEKWIEEAVAELAQALVE